MDDKTAILTAITEYRDAFNAGDVDRLLAVFTPYFLDLEHGVPTFLGPEAPYVLRRRMTKLFAEYRAEMRLAVSTVEVLGDTAYDWGFQFLTLTPKAGGKPVESSQRYMRLWSRQADGGWKIQFIIDNANQPPAMPDDNISEPYLQARYATA